MPVRAIKICASLWRSLDQEPCPASLHSAFQHAANLSTDAGMLTLLPPGKGLQPGSAVLEREMGFSRLGAYSLTVGQDGIFADGAKLISFQQAQRLELRLDEAFLPPGSERPVLDFLSGRRGTGLVSLAFQEADNPWTEFLSPRLLAFRRAVWAGGADGARERAGAKKAAGKPDRLLSAAAEECYLDYLKTMTVIVGASGVLSVYTVSSTVPSTPS